ncbi:MAG: hypothetical protein PUB21_05950 [Bacteroidales bacterium]|nr:hypothetical protein [Bacteroidales bacterium]
MKVIRLITLFFFTALLVSSCTKENMIEPNASFQTSFGKEGKEEASAGVPFYVYVNHKDAEFFTLYNGTAGHVYGEAGATGENFGNSDSLSVTYSEPGVYNLTVVASSTGNWAEDFKRDVRTVEVTVIDQRTTFTSFYFSGVKGDEIQGVVSDDEVIGEVVAIPGRSYNLKPVFSTTAAGAKVYLGSVSDANLQVSGQSVVDFSTADVTPKQYIIVSPNGESRTVSVKLEKVTASSDATLNYVQTLNAKNAVLDVAVPVGDKVLFVRNNSTSASYKLAISSAYGSTIKLGMKNGSWSDFKSTSRYNLADITGIKVIAQNKTEKVYEFIPVGALVSKFVLAGDLNPAPEATIDHSAKTITFNLTGDYNANAMIAKWEGAATEVKVAGTVQDNGVTVNNFSAPVTYSFVYDGISTDYVVTVNITK